MRYLLFIALLFCAITYVGAQEPYLMNLSKANGLPSNSVYDIFQDSKGFVWFGSNAGLTRYDGFEYKTYTSTSQTSAPGSSIIEDKYGRIWYENFDGYLYYVQDDSLNALKQNKPIQYLSITLTQKHLFVFQKKGIDVYDLKTLKIITTKIIGLDEIEFACNNTNNLYFITKDIIYKIDENLTITSAKYMQNEVVDVKQIYAHNEHVYVVSKYNSSKLIYVFNKKLRHLYNINVNKSELIQGISFTDSLVWINTAQGTHAYLNNKLSPLYKTFLNDKSISCVLKDRQDNYWFGTTNEGVFMASKLDNILYCQLKILPNKIVATKKGYIIATKKGEICLYDSLLNFIKIVNIKNDNSEIYYLAYDTLSNDLFYSYKGFSHIPKSDFKNQNFYKLAVKEIVRIDSSYYAFAASGYCGLAKFGDNKKTNSLWQNNYLTNKKIFIPNTASIIGGVRAKSVAFNKPNNIIYFATNIGLFRCSPSKTEEIKFANASFYASKIIIYNNTIYALSTKGELYSIKNDKDFVLLNTVHGIGNFEIKLIKRYENKLVFIANKFVYIFDLMSEKSNKIEVNINDYEVNDVLLKNNTLLFMTNSGIVKTEIKKITLKKSIPILQLNNLFASGKSLRINQISELNYQQNDISVHYSIIDFGSCNENVFYYKLNNDEWKKVSSETRIIEFASLKPGEYSIKFKINNIVYSDTIQFVISAPFWQTIWFIFVCFLAAFLVGSGYYRWQLNKLRIKNKLLEDKNNLLIEKMMLESNLNKSVLKTIKAQMNPHFFYNALNTIQAYIFINDKTKANNYLAKFSKLTRAILEQSEKETITLSEEIESLTLYLELEKMRFNADFDYSIELKTNILKDSIELPPMLIQPYIENAIKHGLLHKEGNKTINLFFEQNINHLFVTINDNGIGRKRSDELNKIKNQKYQSFSTQANQKRLEILNEDNDKIAVLIEDKLDQAGRPSGTKVILTIPIL